MAVPEERVEVLDCVDWSDVKRTFTLREEKDDMHNVTRVFWMMYGDTVMPLRWGISLGKGKGVW